MFSLKINAKIKHNIRFQKKIAIKKEFIIFFYCCFQENVYLKTKNHTKILVSRKIPFFMDFSFLEYVLKNYLILAFVCMLIFYLLAQQST